jgi:hypothetical protein
MKSALIVEDHPMFMAFEALNRVLCGMTLGTCPQQCPYPRPVMTLVVGLLALSIPNNQPRNLKAQL